MSDKKYLRQDSGKFRFGQWLNSELDCFNEIKETEKTIGNTIRFFVNFYLQNKKK